MGAAGGKLPVPFSGTNETDMAQKRTNESRLTRREALRAAARLGVGAGLAVAAWALLRAEDDPSPGRCINEARCGGCSALSGCELGPARRYRGKPT